MAATIEILLDDKGGGVPPGGGGAPGGTGAADLEAAAKALAKSLADLEAKFAAAKSPAGGGGGGPRKPKRPLGAGPYDGLYFGDLDIGEQREEAKGGRPAEASDSEWWKHVARDRRKTNSEEAAAKRKAERESAAADKKAARDAERAEKERARLAEKYKRDADRAAEAERDRERKESHKRSVAGGALGGSIGRKVGAGVGMAVAGPVGGVAGAVLGGAAGSYLGSGGAGLGGALGKGLLFAARGAEEFGKAAVGAARGDGIGLFTQGLNLAADGLAEIPVVGKAAAAGLKMVGAAVNAVNQAVGAFSQRGRELRGYNGQIAGAVARQDVTRLMNDIRESQKLGDSYSKLIDKQTVMEESLKAGLLPLKEWIMGWLPKVMDMILDLLTGMLRCLDKMVPGSTVVGRMADDIQAMRNKLERGDVGAGDRFLERWLVPPHVGFAAAIPVPAPAPLGVPIVVAP